MKIIKFVIVPLLSFAFSGCYERYYSQAQILEKDKKFLEAASYYEKFYNAEKGKSDKSINAIFRAAEIYRDLNLCVKAVPIYEGIVRDNPNSEIGKKSYLNAVYCPEYFPVKTKKMVFGDSQTLGKNAREEFNLANSKDEFLGFEIKIYAGKKQISKLKAKYAKKDYKIFESKNAENRILIEYPIRKNRIWKQGKNNYVHIIDTGLSVKTAAGTFSDCLKIAEYEKNSPFRQIYYYAPFLGRIVSAIEAGGKETRLTELISYESR